MIKLIIHVGLPRTASTTLQEGLFYKLHKMGKINFLGRASRKSWVMGSNMVMESIKEDGIVEQIELSKEKLNVLSEESYSGLRFLFEDGKYGNRISPMIVPERLKATFYNVSDIKIIIVLRSQKNLLFSHYVHYLYYFKEYLLKEDISSFAKYIEYFTSNSRKCPFDYYDYSLIIEQYSKIFGKENVKIMLFEEFVQEKNIFCLRLSELLKLDPELLYNMLEKHHYNKRIESKNGTYYSKRKMKWSNKSVLINSNKNNGLYKLLRKIYYSKWVLSTGLIKIITSQKNEDLIPNPTNIQKEQIFREYETKNRKLINYEDIEVEKLIKYEYI